MTLTLSKRRQHSPAYLRETEQIKENAKTYGEKVHEFKSAKWTHPNGHPRCLRCGQEESISPECNREPTKAEEEEFNRMLNAEFGADTVAKHDGPGPHDSGTPQETHGRRKHRDGRPDFASMDYPGNRTGIAAGGKKSPKATQKKDVRLKSGVVEREVVATTRGRTQKGTLKDATHAPIKVPSRNQIASGKQHIKDNVPKKHEQYATMIARLASRGRVQTPEERKKAAEKYGYDGDELFNVERGVYTAMFGAPAEKVTDHHTIADAPAKARSAMKEMGADHAMPSPDGDDDLLFQDRDKQWHLVDEDGDVTDLSPKEAAAEAKARAIAWGEAERANYTDEQRKRLAKLEAARLQAKQNEKDEREFIKAQKEMISEQMLRAGLDPDNDVHRKAYLGKVVLDELHIQDQTFTEFDARRKRNKNNRKVKVTAADADQRDYRGRKPDKSRRADDEVTTTAKSPRNVKKAFAYISKHGDPDTTPAAVYAAMHPRGRKTKWVRSLAQLDRDVAAGKKLVSGKDGKPLTKARAAKLVEQGKGKHVYAVTEEKAGDAKVTPRSRTAPKVEAAPKTPIKRNREKREGAPIGFQSLGDMPKKERDKQVAKMKSLGIPIPTKIPEQDVWINMQGIQPGRGKNPDGTPKAGAGFGLAYQYRTIAGDGVTVKWQPRYDKNYRADKDAAKNARVRELNELMPKLDAKLASDLKKPNDTAAVVLLMRETGMRVSSDRSTGGETQAFGATTLKVENVKVTGNKVSFIFTQKGGKDAAFEVNNPKLAKMLNRQMKGKEKGDDLFSTNENATRDYIKAATGRKDAINHDLRTIRANALALEYIATIEGAAGPGAPTTTAAFKKRRKEVGEYVSRYLTNTPEMALSSYIDPAIFDRWSSGITKGR